MDIYEGALLRISILQPTYWARTHVWNRILDSDIYVWLDHVQFARGADRWEDRTLLEQADGRELILRLPLNGSKRVPWNEVGVRQDWLKHRKSIEQNYRNIHEDIFDRVYRPAEHMETICWRTLLEVKDILQPRTAIVKSSDFSFGEKKGDLMLEICNFFQADEYLTGAFGASYLPVDDFTEAGVKIVVQDWKAPKTVKGEIANPSILHLMNGASNDEGLSWLTS